MADRGPEMSNMTDKDRRTASSVCGWCRCSVLTGRHTTPFPRALCGPLLIGAKSKYQPRQMPAMALYGVLRTTHLSCPGNPCLLLRYSQSESIASPYAQSLNLGYAANCCFPGTRPHRDIFGDCLVGLVWTHQRSTTGTRIADGSTGRTATADSCFCSQPKN
ncbi:hypothetical protein BDP81DRAFT_183160 [Colletotrichum phormii]|uniref:Uncharacterized protein n=1 Tax=Colletotrichum phormii TaxID=359342 RepID=A0AAI9ZXM3_9PEZI|nr:uncharacterized protein BDP81DRAFT_183160 [Colletotrichum phormii]KAK1639756.1 hypothetical protein BDP81DRAFT_183160 [Colletotrichum phormii]